jgi:hypothetical protein
MRNEAHGRDEKATQMTGNNNQGVDHISRTTGGTTLCKNRNAYMSISIERFRADDGTGRYCRRCMASLAKMDAAKAKRDAR